MSNAVLLILGARVPINVAAVILLIRAAFFVFQNFLLWQGTSKNYQLIGAE